MARQSKLSPPLLMTGAVIVAVFVIVSFFAFSKKAYSKNNFNKCPAFPADSYLNGDALWSNSDYVITGSFQNILLQQRVSDSTLCTVAIEDKKVPLPVIFTASAAKIPLQREQKIKVLVHVEDDGRIVATDCVVE
jgi:hypothetical protein